MDARQKKVKLHFQRYEFKYLLNMDQYYAIRSFVQKHMVLDSYAADTEGGFYDVISLYYDSPKFYYYWEKVDGASKRKKIRLRTYRKNGQFADSVFLEIKRKDDSVILKDRLFLTHENLATFTERGDFLNVADFDPQLLEEYRIEKYRKNLSPTVLVTYSREPYLGIYNKNARITFDYAIRAKREVGLLYDGNDYNDVSGNQVIMELKFNGTMPVYMQQIIHSHQLQRVPYSKYCHGLEACYTLSMLPMSDAGQHSETLVLNRNHLIR